ncbi:MAG: type II toxin-antitoxin system HicA family toxin [Acidobacteria bacterium]|nr:type II toxin-antitoxin system HicA family toxin [Acidobacteriota bacterium]
MPAIGPIKRRDLIRYLLQLGFEGPFSGGKHQFMTRGERTLRIPNPHEGDISQGLLMRILRQAGIAREEWERL